MPVNDSNDAIPTMAQQFETTHWSVVLRASRDGAAQASALEELCRNYWRPLYAYVRRRGHTFEDAQDLTQGFFERLLEKGWLEEVDPNRARFRSFLLTMISRYMANEYHRSTAEKRGGKQIHFSIHDETLEGQLVSEAPLSTPEQDFDRRWALTVLNRAMEQLKDEQRQADKLRMFQRISPFLSQDVAAGDYAQAAGELKVSPGAVAVAVHRMRHRYRELVRREVSQTLSDPNETDIELKHLFESLKAAG